MVLSNAEKQARHRRKQQRSLEWIEELLEVELCLANGSPLRSELLPQSAADYLVELLQKKRLPASEIGKLTNILDGTESLCTTCGPLDSTLYWLPGRDPDSHLRARWETKVK